MKLHLASPLLYSIYFPTIHNEFCSVDHLATCSGFLGGVMKMYIFRFFDLSPHMYISFIICLIMSIPKLCKVACIIITILFGSDFTSYYNICSNSIFPDILVPSVGHFPLIISVFLRYILFIILRSMTFVLIQLLFYMFICFISHTHWVWMVKHRKKLIVTYKIIGRLGRLGLSQPQRTRPIMYEFTKTTFQ